MKIAEIQRRAEKYFENEDIDLIKPGEIGKEKDGRVEVIFTLADALKPNMTLDPPDVRVWVDTITGKVTLIPQI